MRSATRVVIAVQESSSERCSRCEMRGRGDESFVKVEAKILEYHSSCTQAKEKPLTGKDRGYATTRRCSRVFLPFIPVATFDFGSSFIPSEVHVLWANPASEHRKGLYRL